MLKMYQGGGLTHYPKKSNASVVQGSEGMWSVVRSA